MRDQFSGRCSRMTDLVVGAPFYFTDDGKEEGGAVYIYSTPRSGLTQNTKPTKIIGKGRPLLGYLCTMCVPVQASFGTLRTFANCLLLGINS